MKEFIVFLTILVSTYGWSLFGDLSPGLRVHFGIGIPGNSIFYDIARDEAGAIEDGWVNVDRADTYLPSLKMYCPSDDFTFCTLFDDLGQLSGLQVALPVDNFTNPAYDMYSSGFSKWSAPAYEGGEAADYWINQMFFISEESLSANATVRNALRANNETLYEGGVWVPYFNGSLIKISSNHSEQDSLFIRQSCIPAMGRHYYYNVTSDGDCSSSYPWFTLFQDEDLVGLGFVAFGTLPEEESGKRAWFERPSRTTTKIIVPDAPECLYDLTEDPGRVTMHIYFVDHPLLITCISND